MNCVSIADLAKSDIKRSEVAHAMQGIADRGHYLVDRQQATVKFAGREFMAVTHHPSA